MKQTSQKQWFKLSPQDRPPFTWRAWLNVMVLIAAIAGIVYAATLPPDVSRSYSDRLAVFCGALALYALAVVVIALTKGEVPYWRDDNQSDNDDKDF